MYIKTSVNEFYYSFNPKKFKQQHLIILSWMFKNKKHLPPQEELYFTFKNIKYTYSLKECPEFANNSSTFNLMNVEESDKIKS